MTDQTGKSPSLSANLLVISILLRLTVAIMSSGTIDVDNFVRTAELTRSGEVVYKSHEAYPYPPTYAVILAGTVSLGRAIGLDDALSVRIPSIIADSMMTLLVLAIAKQLWPSVAPKLGLLYALNPITIMIASHHGQFDSLAYLPAVAAIWVYLSTKNSWLSALLLSTGGALKITPIFIAPAWLPDIRSIKQLLRFTILTFIVMVVVSGVGWHLAPDPFVANVIQHRQTADGGWGYNFLTLAIEKLAVLLNLSAVMQFTSWLRTVYQPILLLGIMLTAYLTRHRTFFIRVFIVQISIQLFSGRWGHEYTAWLVPLVVLSNQKGILPWGVLTIVWMVLKYLGYDAIGASQDTLFRASTIFGFCSWLILAIWYIGNVWTSKHRLLRWLKAPLFPPSGVIPRLGSDANQVCTKRKMTSTVLFVDHAPAIGGAENSLLLLLQHLDRTRWDPHLACAAGALAQHATSMRVTTHVMDMPRLRRSPRAPIDWASTVSQIAGLARDTGAQCLYANTVRAAIYTAPAARLAHRPFVWHMRDFWLSEDRPRHEWIDTALKRLLCASASQVIVNSHAVARQLPGCERLTVVHNGIEIARFDQDVNTEDFRAQYGMAAETPLVGMIGRLRPWKGQDRFLRVAAKVRTEYPNAHFVIVGGTPFRGADDYVAELHRLTTELGLVDEVTFTGHLQDVRPALAAFDVFVHPGDPEPFGLVNIEAMAMQTPVVAFAHGALPEIVRDGITGILVAPKDEKALASAVIALLNDPERRRAYGEAARKRVESHFDIAQTAENIDHILNRVVKVYRH